jgi:3-dehydroquinate dehydratase
VTSGSLLERHRASDGVSIETNVIGPGEFTSFSTDYVHDVLRESSAPVVSIHAYSPPSSALTFYDRTRFGFVAREFIEEERRSRFSTTPPLLEDA